MRARRAALHCLRLLVGAAFLAGAVRASLFTVYRVAGTSMLDTLDDGDRILVCDAPFFLGAVEPGDTVVLSVDGEVLVKRVVAGPGDCICLRSGTLIRNGRLVTEDIPARYAAHDDLVEHRMALDEVFVLGDNRAVSVDSRDFGPVPLEQVLGRVVLRLAPGRISTVSALERDLDRPR